MGERARLVVAALHLLAGRAELVAALSEASSGAISSNRLFYFCGNHRGTGLNGELFLGTQGTTTTTSLLTTTSSAALSQRPGTRSEFDQMCGSVGTVDYAAGAADDVCSGATFLCGSLSTPLHQCFDVADCKMATEMRTRIEATQDPIVTFMHQMIPHHANAINMAKSLLKLHDERVADDEIGILLYSMINWQTLQMRFMEDYLAAAGAPNPVAARSCPRAVPALAPAPAPPLPSSPADSRGSSAVTAPGPAPAPVPAIEYATAPTPAASAGSHGRGAAGAAAHGVALLLLALGGLGLVPRL
jgi:cell division septation protein DedD